MTLLNRNGCLKKPPGKGCCAGEQVLGLIVVLAVWGFKGNNDIKLQMA